MTLIGGSYEEALAAMLAGLKPLGPEKIALVEAVGRVPVAELKLPLVQIMPGVPLRPEQIALLAAAGFNTLEVVRRPRVAIVAAGDELLPVGAAPVPGKVYDSDSLLLAAMVRRDGGQPLTVGIAHDNLSSLRMRLAAAIAGGAELILTVAGAHYCGHDLVRELIEAEGQLLVWQVAMEPDRPLLFGLLAGVAVLGLPGAPAEALVCAELFARPALLHLAGHRQAGRSRVQARLETPTARHLLSHYARGSLHMGEHGYSVALDQHSSLVDPAVNALVLIPPGEGDLPMGSPVEVLVLQ